MNCFVVFFGFNKIILLNKMHWCTHTWQFRFRSGGFSWVKALLENLLSGNVKWTALSTDGMSSFKSPFWSRIFYNTMLLSRRKQFGLWKKISHHQGVLPMEDYQIMLLLIFQRCSSLLMVNKQQNSDKWR